MEINDKDISEYRNDWALDTNSDYIHISKAESGANGYYCLGCDKEMQACKGDKKEHYFRHHIKDVNKEKIECVVASRKYRERIAASILNEIKFVKVPALYKFSPKHIDGLPMLLEDSKIIKAAYTKAELTFYEDDDGIIHWGSNKDIEDRSLLVRPDVTLFDKDNNPILFVEFVINHKPDEEKRNKLKRLGIDAVQIIIPKLPEPEIEKAIKSVTKYKWIYNELEANTKYIPVSKTYSKAVQQIDEEQVNLIRESFECKSAEIKQLIFSVEKCLQSKQYRTTARTFEFEISRVKNNTERERTELGNLEESNRREAFERNRGKEEEENIRYGNLERRYLDKTDELEESTDIIRREEQFIESTKERIQSNREYKLRLEGETKRLEIEINNFEEEVGREVSSRFENSIKSKIKEIEDFDSRIETIDEEIRESIDRDCIVASRDIEELGVRYGDLEERVFEEFRESINDIERELTRVRKDKNSAENEIFEEFRGDIEFEKSEVEKIGFEQENIEKSVRKQFDRDIKSNSREFTEELRSVLEIRRILNDYLETESEEKEYKRLYELFRKGVGL